MSLTLGLPRPDVVLGFVVPAAAAAARWPLGTAWPGLRGPLRASLQRAARRRRLRREVREFVLAGERVPPALSVRTRELLPAVLTYLGVGRRFRRDGLAAALQLVPEPRGVRSVPGNDEVAAFCARSAGVRILGVARTVAGRHLCLHESLALTAALRRLGFCVEVIVGYPVIELVRGGEELHAWPQLGDIAVTDRLGSAPMSFVEVARYPHHPQPQRTRHAAT
jgi:hypothetical protein